MKRLLVNWVYFEAVGHAMEGLRYAYWYAQDNPDLEVSVLLNSRTAIELGWCVPGIVRVYPVAVKSFQTTELSTIELAKIPRDWDYELRDPRIGKESTYPHLLERCWDHLTQHLRPGLLSRNNQPPPGFPHRSNTQRLRLNLPQAGYTQARRLTDAAARPRIAILPAPGSGTASRAPSLLVWRKLLLALRQSLGDISVFTIGSSRTGRPTTSGITPEQIEQLAAELPWIHNAFDFGLLNQLALIDQCDLFISPHSGFAFAAQCTDTPWLALSGGEWPDYWLGGVPFACIYPGCDRYPCQTGGNHRMLEACEQARTAGRPFGCFEDSALLPRIPEAVRLAEELISGRRSWPESVAAHRRFFARRYGIPENEIRLEGSHIGSDEILTQPS